MLKTLLCSIIGLILIANLSYGQLPNTYQFSYSSGTYTALSGGTTLNYLNGVGPNNADDGYVNAIPIGFTFTFNGVNYTTINVCANGFLTFGAALPATGYPDTWTNSVSTFALSRPILAPLWDDMDNGFGSTKYLLSGSAPDRTFTVQWTDQRWIYSATSAVMSYQVVLHETTNVIDFIYSQGPGTIVNGDGGASIGIGAAGTGSGNFMSVTNSGASPSVSSTTETTSISTKPANGQIYSFIPYCSTSTNNHAGTELISRVQFGSIDNSTTSTNQYENFTNLSTFVQPSTAVPITITLANSYSGDKVLVWIDFNHNGSFTDAGEQVYSSPNGAGPFTTNITIPAVSATVLLGPTRMRVKLDDTGGSPSNLTPCGLSDWGQVEDYTVNIQNCSPVTISAQPANTPICNGGNGTITVGTTGTGPTYQWQVSTNGGTSYTNLTNTAPYSGVTTSALTFTGATSALNGYLYRVMVGGTCSATLTSSAAVLSINTPAAITTNPTNQTVCVGSNATMSVVATGGVLNYQWQLSTNGGGSYSDISGATSSTLLLPAVTSSMSLNRYRVVVTVPSCNTVTSTGAILNVNPLPTVTLAAAPSTEISPGVPAFLTVTSVPAGASYSWTLNGATITGANTNKVAADVNSATGLGTYRATVTDVNGCVNSSNNVTITAKTSTKLFIYPNPSSDGLFQVRLFTLALNDVRTVTIYNSQGDIVVKKLVSVANPYTPVSFDLRGAAPGVYFIHVTHRYNKNEEKGKLIIQ